MQGKPPTIKGINPATQQISVNLSAAKSVGCDACGNQTFQEVYLMKYLSELQSPTGKAGNVPIPTFACNACGHVNLGFLPRELRPEDQTSTTGGQPSSLLV